MYVHRRSRRHNPVVGWLIGGLAVLAGLALAAVLAVPRVTRLEPENAASGVARRTPIRLTFSSSVAQVQARLEPDWPGQWQVTGQEAVFTPAQPWPETTTITVRLIAATSPLGIPALPAGPWTFLTGRDRLAYLTGSPANLVQQSIATGEASTPLTNEPLGVYDYALAPDGRLAVYAARRADDGADLIRLDLTTGLTDTLLACPNALCRAPTFAPDATRLAYERLSPQVDLLGEPTYGAPVVYVLTLAGGAPTSVGTPDRQTRTPQFAPDGRLSFYDVAREAVAVRDLTTGAETYIPVSSGEMGSWTPDARFLVVADITLRDRPAGAPTPTPLPGVDIITPVPADTIPDFFSHLRRVQVSTNAAENLSGDAVVEDAAPVVSPNGQWIAFARRNLLPELWSPGRQVWVMALNGGSPRPLTADPIYNHSALTWNADATLLALMRRNATEPEAPSEIWLLALDPANPPRRLADNGYLPRWVP